MEQERDCETSGILEPLEWMRGLCGVIVNREDSDITVRKIKQQFC